MTDSWSSSSTGAPMPSEIANPRDAARKFKSGVVRLAFLLSRNSVGKQFDPPYLIWVMSPIREQDFREYRSGIPRGCRCPVLFPVPARESDRFFRHYGLTPPHGNGPQYHLCYCNGHLVE